MDKCIFLDRDGVLNEERGEHTFKIEDFIIPEDVPETLQKLKKLGYLLIVITNQSGISQGIYTREQMKQCHQFLQESCNGILNAIYYSPYHPSVTESLSRKPGTLMFERAVAQFKINRESSWMVGDKERDLIPAKKLNLNTILKSENNPETNFADFRIQKFREILDIVQ